MRLVFSWSSSSCIVRSVASSRSSSPSLLNTLTSSEGPRSSPPPPLAEAADPLEVEAVAAGTAGGDADAAVVVDGADVPKGDAPPAEAIVDGPMPAAAAGGVAVTAAGILEGGILSLFTASIFTRSFPRHHFYVWATIFRDFHGLK